MHETLTLPPLIPRPHGCFPASVQTSVRVTCVYSKSAQMRGHGSTRTQVDPRPRERAMSAWVWVHEDEFLPSVG
jgi:hypothetical protein